MRWRWLLIACVVGACDGQDDFLAVRDVRDAGTMWSDAGTDAPPTRIAVTDFGGVSGLRRNGSAIVVGAALRLTDAVDAQTGSAFFETPFPLGPSTRFSVAFSYRIVRGVEGLADGIAWVLQSSPKGPAVLGRSGEGLGLVPIAPAVAVELDEHQNKPTEASANHVAIVRDGAIKTPIVETPCGFPLAQPAAVFVWIDFDAGWLEVRVAPDAARPPAPTVRQAVPLSDWLGPSAYLGFTASTGERNAIHELLTLSVAWGSP